MLAARPAWSAARVFEKGNNQMSAGINPDTTPSGVVLPKHSKAKNIT